jgi:hypothetical protein
MHSAIDEGSVKNKVSGFGFSEKDKPLDERICVLFLLNLNSNWELQISFCTSE